MTDVTGMAKGSYEPPKLVVLGSFGELTAGGTPGQIDQTNGAGDSDII
jgi:hypothetical protein